ncbi:MAG: hypothetical protein A2092_11980 [Rhodobacteraceae bacterium GWE1_64_9]|nr:MAG: hypothetical protein A2092_11980 [Rhodobacteraceae bacterium GWE1_64_9]
MTDLGQHHAERLAQAHQRLDAHENRLTKLEIHSAGEAVRSQNIERSLGEIQSGITWITRLVIGGIIAGAVAFVLSGGLNVSP